MVLYIRRADSNDHCVIGVAYTDGFCCYTLELPWVNNKRNVSCIPTGQYTAAVDHSTAIGGVPVIRLDNVPDRDGILIHVANAVGEIQGCVAVGMGRTTDTLLGSKAAMADLLGIVDGKPLVIDIDWA